jgi:hypothetical protein
MRRIESFMKVRALRALHHAALLTALTLSSAVAGAQPVAKPAAAAPSMADRLEAQKQFAAGNKLKKKGEDTEALAAFVKANALQPLSKHLRAVAEAHRAVKDDASAYTAYDELVKAYGAGPVKSRDVKEAEKALAELGPLTGVIVVSRVEPGATLTLDDKVLGTAPLATSALRVNAGSHKLTVAKEKFITQSQELTLKGGEELAVDAALAPQPGRLSPRGPEGAVIFIDGKEVGKLPWEGELAPGSHTLSAQTETTSAKEQTITVVAAEPLTVDLAMEVETIGFKLKASDPKAEIRLDGKTVGHGSFAGDVPLGTHALEITLAGYVPQKRELALLRGQPFDESVVLVPADDVTSEKPGEDRLDWFTLAVKGGLAYYGCQSVTGPARTAGNVQLNLDFGGDGFAFELAPYFAMGDVLTAGAFLGPVYRIPLLHGTLYPSIGFGLKGGYQFGSTIDMGAEAFGRVPLGVTYYPLKSLGILAEVGGGYGVTLAKGKGMSDLNAGHGLLIDAMMGVRFP